MTPEGAVKAKAKKILTELGYYFFMPPANGFGRAGIPDIVGCKLNGCLFALECKAGKTNPLRFKSGSCSASTLPGALPS